MRISVCIRNMRADVSLLNTTCSVSLNGLEPLTYDMLSFVLSWSLRLLLLFIIECTSMAKPHKG